MKRANEKRETKRKYEADWESQREESPRRGLGVGEIFKRQAKRRR
jgi:hypothetical protein